MERSLKMSRYVTYQQEIQDYLQLIAEIVNDPWVDSSLTLVNCNPEYSSYLSQILNHKISFINSNTLFEELQLKFPPKDMVQVWDEGEFKPFDKYIEYWFSVLDPDYKYLFVFSVFPEERHFKKFKGCVKSRLDTHQYKVACTYIPSQYSNLVDYKVKEINPIFEWQNMNK